MGRELQLQLPASTHYVAILLISWHLWKARNAAIFDHLRHTARDVLRRVVYDMDLWRQRYKHHQAHWEAWRCHNLHLPRILII
ncbi:hypothetical protein HU200_019354 [Digitaria exilis]|uniref:Uncharacterized protein n=1 Tax=Digitaria exilis TaxID=1010633 RepID=A0A835F3F2_9POAL|nr:hypothetical protein HU200_019354 [Digitaria exilis]